MKKSANMLLLFLIIPLVLALVPGARPLGSATPIDPSAYPEISDVEMGQMLWALTLADLPLDDYTDLEAIDQYGMTSYRYAFAFMTYFLAVEQYHKLPAWPEMIQPRMDRFIQKIIQKPVWEFWAEISRGLPNLEPKFNRPYPEVHDPVADMNIMYSGHVGHMVGLYEMLYRDFKWDQPGSITFAWSDEEKYPYNHHALNQVMYEQMKNKPYHCIECEPNVCFPECNQHPILSFMLHDHVHGTNMAPVRDLFLDFFLEKKMIDPRTHETAMLYLIKQDLTLSTQNPRYGNILDVALVPAVKLRLFDLDSSSANGWTGAFMHAWQPELIERHYPYMRDHAVIDQGDKARLDVTIWEPQLKYGFFAVLAAEMGDLETRDRVIRFADEKYKPYWDGGFFRYPCNLNRGPNNLTGILLALARALPGNGLWTMHNQPFDQRHFAEPRVAGVEYPAVVLRRAVYDRERKALIVTAERGVEGKTVSSLTVENLDPRKTYRLSIDGESTGKVSGKNSIKVELVLDPRRDVVLTEL